MAAFERLESDPPRAVAAEQLMSPAEMRVFLTEMSRLGYARLHDSMSAIITENRRLRDLVHCLADNDPTDIVGGRMRLLDVWRQVARELLGTDD